MLAKFPSYTVFGNISVVRSLIATPSQQTNSNWLWGWGNFNSIGSKKKLGHKWRLRNAKRSVGSAKDPIGEKGPKNKDLDEKKKRTRTKKV